MRRSRRQLTERHQLFSLNQLRLEPLQIFNGLLCAGEKPCSVTIRHVLA